MKPQTFNPKRDQAYPKAAKIHEKLNETERTWKQRWEAVLAHHRKRKVKTTQ